MCEVEIYSYWIILLVIWEVFIDLLIWLVRVDIERVGKVFF